MRIRRLKALCLASALHFSIAASRWVAAGPPQAPPVAHIDEQPHFPNDDTPGFVGPRRDVGDVWPYGPFSTKGRDIVNKRGEVIVWSGVNWPLSGETMIPEGLEFASAEGILGQIASVGFNFIRMGYAFEMVDQIYERDGQDVSLELSMTMGLGLENGTKVTQQIIKHNPRWTAATTRFEVWSDIVTMAHKKKIFVHPDLHVGKAMWCCSHEDGNAWFDDIHFNTANWHRALAHIATWSTSFPNIVSMSLRNELRESHANRNLVYNWETLVGNMTAGATTIHTANPDLLITWSGMQYDQDLSALTTGANLLTAPCYKCTAVVDRFRRDPVYFDPDAYPWGRKGKLVWELHLYNTSEDVDTGDCDVIQAALYRNGFNALGIGPPTVGCETLGGGCEPTKRLTPVILSEFGQTPEDGSIFKNVLVNCVHEFTVVHKVSWAMWSMAGYFRTRQGVQGFVDPKGLFNASFDGWHEEEVVRDFWAPWINSMRAADESVEDGGWGRGRGGGDEPSDL